MRNRNKTILLATVLMLAVLPVAIQTADAAGSYYWMTIPMEMADNYVFGVNSGIYYPSNHFARETDGHFARYWLTVAPIPSYATSIRILIEVKDGVNPNPSVLVLSYKGVGTGGPYSFQSYDPDSFSQYSFGTWYKTMPYTWKGSHLTMETISASGGGSTVPRWYFKEPVVQCLIPYSPI